ncbi:hypothetical protein NDNC_0520 [Candidatus Nasuia deltocephalinicola]|nr:hypothetical protein NDNC_0520 [Candidatus Nasuia deltocephalinicola]
MIKKNVKNFINGNSISYSKKKNKRIFYKNKKNNIKINKNKNKWKKKEI